jgi:predicted carbohydrate-binding protein with CBM5 and CBM33 domain
MQFLAAALLSLVGQTAAHGLVTTPAARNPGAATAAVCGQNMVTFYKSDNTSYPEALKRSKGWDTGYNAAKCNLYLCKGFQFDDNKDNVHKYKAGEEVNMEVFIRIPHKGYANVSVVDLQANSVIGEPLKVWKDNYAASLNNPVDQTKFSVRIPELSGKCTEANQCVS